MLKKIQTAKSVKNVTKEVGRLNSAEITTKTAGTVAKESAKSLIKHGVKQYAKLAKKAIDGNAEQ